MRKGIKGLLMLCVIMLTLSIFILDAKAASRSTIVIKRLTQTGVEIDFTEDVKKSISKWPKVKVDNFDTFELPRCWVELYEYNNSKKGEVVYERSESYTKDYSDVITGLKPRTRYRLDVSYKLEMESGHIFQSYEIIHTPGYEEPFKLKQAGCTDTSITIDMREAYKTFEAAVEKRGSKCFYSDYKPYIGYATRNGLNDPAYDAWDQAMNGNQFIDKSAFYTITDLNPSTYYYVYIMLIYNDRKTGDTQMDYFIIDDAHTAPRGNYTQLTHSPKYDTSNTDVDPASKLNSMYFNLRSDNIASSSTENSITIDWSKRTGEQNLTDVRIGYALCSNLDLDEDIEQYGSVDNVGPYFREAFNMCAKKSILVADSKKSYTITGLKPASRYAVAIAGKEPGKNNLLYFKAYINTIGAYDSSWYFIDNAKKASSYQMAFMYDAKTYKEGSNTIVDWTEAMNEFISQSFWKNLNAKPTEDEYSYIDYEEVTVNSADRTDNYNASASHKWTDCIATEKCATKARIFGLDPSKKYVFNIKTSVTYFYRGDKCKTDVYFYVDETGTNYVKLRKLGQDRPTREHQAKLATLKNHGVLDVDISNGEFTLTGSVAKEIFDTLKLANGRDYKPQYSNGGWNLYKGDFYGYDLNADYKTDVRLYYSNENSSDKCKVMFDKDQDDFSVKEANISIPFEEAFLTLLKDYALENNWTGYYSGINFIFKSTKKAEGKKDESSKKDESKKKEDQSNSSSNKSDSSSKKSDSKSKKDNTDNSSKNDKTDNSSGKTSSSAKQQKKGRTITCKGYKYEITSSNTVKLIAPVKKSVKTVNVPSKIKYSKKNYKVTEIGDSAFKGCKKLQKVTVSSNVKVIGKKAFYGCKKLKTVEIKSKNLKKVGKNAFDKTSKNLKISVPKKKLKNYKNVLKKAGVKSGKLKSAKK